MEELIERAKKGDRDAFTVLVLKNEGILSRVAMSVLDHPEDAADAVQEAVFSAWKHLGALRKPQYFRTWLTRILLRECYRMIDQRNRHRHDSLEELQGPAPEPDRDDSLDVRSVLMKLSREERLVLGLYYQDGLSVKEISLALGITGSAAKQRLYRSRKRFQQIYEKGRHIRP